MSVATSSEPQLVRGDDDELEESVSQASRDEAVKSGDAFPDGSFPIRDQDEADKAWNLRGHNENHGEASIVAHIRKQVEKHGLRMPGDSPKPKVKPKKRKTARESERLQLVVREVAKSGDAYECVILKEGPGNQGDRRYYTKAALQALVASGMCEGLQAYADHPTASEERDRPERSVRHLVGHFSHARFQEVGGVGEVRAKFHPVRGPGFEWVTSLIESALDSTPGKPLVGLSINGEGATEPGEIDGKPYHLVREVTSLGSADLVTRAGAGGRFVRRLSEAWQDAEAGAGDDLVLTAAQVQERVRGGVVALVGALATEDDGLARDAIRRLHEAGHATVPKPTRRRGKGDERLREQLDRADERRKLAEAEVEAITERARLAARMVGKPDIPAVTRSRWFDSLLEQADEASMRETLGRLEEERREELAGLRESLGSPYGVEGAGLRQPIVPAAPTGGGLLERLGLDRDELLEA